MSISFKNEIKQKFIGYRVQAGNEKYPCVSEVEFAETIEKAIKYFRDNRSDFDGVDSTLYHKAEFFEISPVYDHYIIDYSQSIKLTKAEVEAL